MGATAITSDPLSRITTVKDGKGQTKTFSYDKLDRVTQVSYSNGDTIKYTHDDNGNQTKRVDSVQGTSEWDYDDLNRRTDDDLPSGDNSYTWDAASNLTALADSGGGITKYGYDDANRLTSLAEAGGSCTPTVSLCTTFGYNDRDQRTSTAFPNGVTQGVDYDLSGKPKEIEAAKGGTTLTEFKYTYTLSPTGEGTVLRTAIDKDGNKTTYKYDPELARLTAAVEKDSAGTTTLDDRVYSYDPASNLKKQTINGTTTSYGYDDANELCWEHTGTSSNVCASPPSGATTYTHDANGNTTASSLGLALSYNIKDQTTSYTPAGGSAISFGYADSSQTERTSAAGTTQHNSTLGLIREGTNHWTREPGGALISQNTAGTRHYYLTDRLGSVAGLADASGALAQTYKYDPYGRIRSTTGSVANPFRYTGAYQSGGTSGLYKMGARYYNPIVARWTQRDPFDQPDDLRNGNRYVYAASDPANLVDPEGTFPTMGEIMEVIHDVNRQANDVFYFFNKTTPGRLIRNCVITGGGAGIIGRKWDITKPLFVIGCATVTVIRKGK